MQLIKYTYRGRHISLLHFVCHPTNMLNFKVTAKMFINKHTYIYLSFKRCMCGAVSFVSHFSPLTPSSS